MGADIPSSPNLFYRVSQKSQKREGRGQQAPLPEREVSSQNASLRVGGEEEDLFYFRKGEPFIYRPNGKNCDQVACLFGIQRVLKNSFDKRLTWERQFGMI